MFYQKRELKNQPAVATRRLFAFYWLTLIPLVLILGKDYNWDMLNYHLYTPELLFGWRFEQDYLAASVQGYLNPLLDIPFYVLVRALPDARLVALMMCGLHAINLVLLHRITQSLLEEVPGWRTNIWLPFFATALGAISPIFLAEVGTSLVDGLWSIPLLWGVLLWLRSNDRDLSGLDLLWVGGLMGAAVALKLVAIFGAGALIAADLVSNRPGVRLGFRRMVAYFAGLGAGFAVFYGWWGLILWIYFDNPFFPFFNQTFQSELYPPVGIASDRFVPGSFLAAASFPWDVLRSDILVYNEKPAPDVRFLFAAVFLLILIGRKFFMKCREVFSVTEAVTIRFLTLAFFYYGGWLLISANGRYGLPLILILGPVCVSLLLKVGDGARWVMYGLGGLLSTQLFLNYEMEDVRWHSKAEWGEGSYIKVQYPVGFDLKSSPNIFLSTSLQTNAILVAHSHQSSRFVNLIGQKTIDPYSQQWRHVREMIANSGLPIRSLQDLGPPSRLKKNENLVKSLLDEQDLKLSRYGLRLYREDCAVLSIDGAKWNQGDWRPQLSASALRFSADMDENDAPIMTCRLSIMGNPPDFSQLPGAKDADRMIRAFEVRCGNNAKTGSTTLERTRTGYSKFYANWDVSADWRSADGSVNVWRLGRYIGKIRPGSGEMRSLEKICLALKGHD
jgi:hypothetical protein